MQEAPKSSADGLDERRERIHARVGRVLAGAFRLEELLGVGGMAAVYQARREDGSTVALKVLHREHAGNAAIATRFLREAEVTRRVAHPAVVRFGEDGVTEDGELFVVMERLLGETLRDEWRRTGETVPPERVLVVADGLLDALVACHDVGVVHRDLKPANVFVTSSGGIKLLDFGVAHVMGEASDLAAAGTALGTPSYMAPEQAMGHADRIDPRTDLFGLAALLHALLTGRRVHTATTHAEALRLAATEVVPSVARLAPHLPEDVLALVDRALAWDPRARFPNARDMQASVRGALHVLGMRSRASERPRPLSEAPRMGSAADLRGRGRREPSFDSLAAVTDTPAAAALRALDRALGAARAYGADHPASVRAALDLTTFARDAARDAPLEVRILPYGASVAGAPPWEPLPPLDAVVHELHAAGVRALRLHAAITPEAVRELVSACLEAGRAAETDAATEDVVERFFCAEPPGVELTWVDPLDEADGAGRAAFVGAVDELERALAAQPAARALGGSATPLRTAVRALALPPAVEEVFVADASLPREAWEHRFASGLAEGLRGAASPDRVARALVSLAAHARALGRRGAGSDLARLVEALLAELPPDDPRAEDVATAALAPAVLVDLAASGGGPGLAAVARVAERLPASALGALLDALGTASPASASALATLLRGFLARAVRGNETRVALTSVTAHPAVGVVLVDALAGASTPEAAEALARLAQEAGHAVRAAAAAAVGGAVANDALGAMLASSDPDARVAALGAAARAGLAWMAPDIGRRLRAALADASGPEAEAWFRASVHLDARSLAAPLEVVRQGGGLLSSGPKDVVRAAAVRVLGDVADDPDVADALDDLARGRRGVSDETRAAAASAAALVRARVDARFEGGLDDGRGEP